MNKFDNFETEEKFYLYIEVSRSSSFCVVSGWMSSKTQLDESWAMDIGSIGAKKHFHQWEMSSLKFFDFQRSSIENLTNNL